MKALLTIGNFDGVHRGHLALVQNLSDKKRLYGEDCRCVVLTFEPHPREVLGGQPVERLTQVEEKCDLLKRAGADEVRIIPFSLEFAKTPAKDFFENILIGNLNVLHIAVGYNFLFGHERKGTPEKILEWSKARGITAERVRGVEADGEYISSSRIRKLIREGHLPAANRLLGRDYSLKGPVQHGDKRGREFGFPTANLYPLQDQIGMSCLPATGVYLSTVTIDDENRTFAAVTNVGYKPTIAKNKPFCIESHLLDFSGNLYEKIITVEFKDRLRGEKKFSSIQELKEQIQIDISTARRRLS